MSYTRRTCATRLCVAVFAASALAPALVAQGGASPAVHWGGQFLPDVTDRFGISLSFVGFTQYGKDTLPTGPDGRRFRFTPYNDIDRTIGFNVLSFVRTQTGTRFGSGNESVSTGSVTTRSSLSIGIVADEATEFLQNNFAHANALRNDKLLDIPRDTLRDRPGESASISRYRKAFPPVVVFGQEYFVRLHAYSEDEQTLERLPTQFFVGGGWQVGTVNQEAFVTMGSNVIETKLDWCLLKAVGVGAAARGGLVAKGYYLNDVYPSYLNMQGVVRARFDVMGWASELDYSLTSAHGFFVQRRDATDRAAIDLYAPETRTTDRLEGKRPARELFMSARLRTGNFYFEINNDSPGGKDAGPSFAAHMGYTLLDPAARIRGVSWILDRLKGTR